MSMPVVQLLQSMFGLSAPSSSEGGKGLFTATDKATGLDGSEAGGKGQFEAAFEKAFSDMAVQESEALRATSSDEALTELLASGQLSGSLSEPSPETQTDGYETFAETSVEGVDGISENVSETEVLPDPVETARLTLKADVPQQGSVDAEEPWPRMPLFFGANSHAQLHWRLGVQQSRQKDNSEEAGHSPVHANHSWATSIRGTLAAAVLANRSTKTEEPSLPVEGNSETSGEGFSVMADVAMDIATDVAQEVPVKEMPLPDKLPEIQLTTEVIPDNPTNVAWAMNTAAGLPVSVSSDGVTVAVETMDELSDGIKTAPVVPSHVTERSHATLPTHASERARQLHGSGEGFEIDSVTENMGDDTFATEEPELALPSSKSHAEKPHQARDFSAMSPHTGRMTSETQASFAAVSTGHRPETSQKSERASERANETQALKESVRFMEEGAISFSDAVRESVPRQTFGQRVSEMAQAKGSSSANATGEQTMDAVSSAVDFTDTIIEDSAVDEVTGLSMDDGVSSTDGAESSSGTSVSASSSEFSVSGSDASDAHALVHGLGVSVSGAHGSRAASSGGQALSVSVANQVTDATVDAAMNNQSRVTLTLNPDDLGTVRINLIQRNAGHGQAAQLHARIVVSSPEAQKLLSQQMARLGETLSEHNIRLENIQVLVAEQSGVTGSAGSSQTQSQLQQQARQDDGQQQQSGSQNGQSFQQGGSNGQGSSSQGWGGQSQERRPEFNLADVARSFNPNLSFNDLLDRENTRDAVLAGRANLPQTHEDIGPKHRPSKGGASRPV